MSFQTLNKFTQMKNYVFTSAFSRFALACTTRFLGRAACGMRAATLHVTSCERKFTQLTVTLPREVKKLSPSTTIWQQIRVTLCVNVDSRIAAILRSACNLTQTSS
ncbi:hypothetical protein NPIL_440951 [Nephila pilipes]|uniref:Uncharacterized protein n=1 Tax=Nephila pilipes TaxID=299642 RepID=A0A8X6P3M4_NEPPI|nr:hypothetical protein NPIL_440951 [Nephila pilipes]